MALIYRKAIRAAPAMTRPAGAAVAIAAPPVEVAWAELEAEPDLDELGLSVEVSVEVPVDVEVAVVFLPELVEVLSVSLPDSLLRATLVRLR